MKNDATAYVLPLRGDNIPFCLKRRKNQKNVNLKISLEGRLIVSAPFKTELSRIFDILQGKETWILKHLNKTRKKIHALNPLETILFNGRQYRVKRIMAGKREKIKILAAEGVIHIKSFSKDENKLASILEKGLKLEAKKKLPTRLESLSKVTGIPYSRISIRNQRTRWGSSSGRGNISLNWRIIMTPPEVQDYLLLHELAHQAVHSHSKRYWCKVKALCPDYKKYDKWLKEHARLMYTFRPLD
ncbi:MAG: SprT family zinc-dependent metalloprotease [Spirochaetota bacterium]